MIFVRNGIITRRLQDFEPKDLECICIELTLSKKKWAIFSVCRPQSENMSGFFDTLANLIDRAINTYDTVVIMADINIYTQDHQSQGINKFFEFCDVFGLQNLIKSNTCETKTSSTLIDVILSNQVKSFRHSKTVETGISDFHKLVKTSFRSTYQRVRPTKIKYRSYIRLLMKMPFWQT